MRRKRSARIIAVYVASLVVTVALLVWWIVYVLQSVEAINSTAERLGRAGETSHWFVLGIGAALFGLLIVGLTFQLAHALGERNYSRKQEEFVANVTHEMKSPLAAIKLHAQTLQDEEVSAVDVRRSIGFILQQVVRMETLVDNVLESSRLAARKKLLHLQPIPLGPFLDLFLQEIRVPIEGRGVRLQTDVHTSATVLATTEALRRIMTNLLENAARFSVRGGEVRCRVCDDGPRVRIEVEDDGIGIPRSELERVFDRFYQIGRELSQRRGGTGLGLSIVFGLVKELRGSVQAYSHDGRPGSRFVVTLPVAPVQP